MNLRNNFLILVFSLMVCSFMHGCKTKEGCGLEEKYAPKTNKDGRLSTKRGKTQLFSPKIQKKMKKSKA